MQSRKLAAIMFTDIVGFTALAQKDEGKAMRLLAQHNDLMRLLIPKYSGREVKTIGDAFLIEFPERPRSGSMFCGHTRRDA